MYLILHGYISFKISLDIAFVIFGRRNSSIRKQIRHIPGKKLSIPVKPDTFIFKFPERKRQHVEYCGSSGKRLGNSSFQCYLLATGENVLPFFPVSIYSDLNCGQQFRHTLDLIDYDRLREPGEKTDGIINSKASYIHIFQIRIAEIRKKISYSCCLSALAWSIYCDRREILH